MAIALSACGGGEGTATSCEQYLDKDESEQLELAGEVAQQGSRGGVSDSMAKAVSRRYRTELIEYCEQPGHDDDKLKDLQLGFGP